MRLTYKLEEPIETKYLHYDYMRIGDYDISRGNYGRITNDEIYNKLGQIEDIEEELGIDLITFLKIFLQGYIWIAICDEDGLDFDKVAFEHLDFKKEIIYTRDWVRTWYKKDYGKTWALTKEELK